jgi:PPP family 3-phenylpropionic acid transporter
MDIKISAKISALQCCFWALYAASFVYATPFLQERHFSSLEIGMISAGRYLAVIIFQFGIAVFINYFSARFSLKSIIIFLSSIGFFATLMLSWIHFNFFMTMLIFILFGLTINCVYPLLESLTVYYMNEGRKVAYNIARSFGSASWGIASVILGWITITFDVEKILLFQLLSYAFLILATLLLDKLNKKTVPYVSKERNQKYESSFLNLLKRFPKFTFYLLGVIFIFMTYNLSSIFLIDVVRNIRGTSTEYGWIQFVLAVSEIPFTIFIIQLKNKFSIDYLMILCALFNMLKAVGILVAPNIIFLLFSQITEGPGLAIFYAGSIYFVMEHLPSEYTIKANSLVNISSVGIGEAIASLLSGYLRETVGLTSLLEVSVMLGFISVIFMIIMALKHEKPLPELSLND